MKRRIYKTVRILATSKLDLNNQKNGILDTHQDGQANRKNGQPNPFSAFLISPLNMLGQIESRINLIPS